MSYTKADASKLDVLTHVGKAPTPDTLKRFLVGPVGCELTGFCVRAAWDRLSSDDDLRRDYVAAETLDAGLRCRGEGHDIVDDLPRLTVASNNDEPSD